MSPVRYTSEAKNATSKPYAAAEFIAMADAFRKVPPELRRQLGNRLRPIGEKAVAAARSNASWSSRIPGAISMRVEFNGNNPGLVISVDHKAAPHARPFEGILSPSFRHPVFGDTDRWVSQDARPFVWPAVLATQQEIAPEVEAAIDATLAAAGFH